MVAVTLKERKEIMSRDKRKQLDSREAGISMIWRGPCKIPNWLT